MRNLTDPIIDSALFCFTRIFGFLPRKIGIGTGVAMGRLAYTIVKRSRNIALNNLRNAYPEKKDAQIQRIAKAVFENLGKLLYEICWSNCLNNDELRRHVKIEGMAHIQTAYAKGKGVLVLTGHFGNWELMPVVGHLVGHPFSIVYRPLDFKPLERFTIRSRTRYGGSMIPKKRSFRKILNSLDRKEMVTLLMDQNVAAREGVFVPFFNMPACTNEGLALLALKTGAPVVPAFLLREKKGFTGMILPEVPLIRTGDKIKDLEANTSAYNQVIESVVRRYPDQWFWVHRRWNTKPPAAMAQAAQKN
ncbi:MAG: lysophospholipid acyltransferase family protein [Desulfobacterales bacterium]|nr:lysophospholipid acyltransferase family protein [Desulfobacterales bacterium]